MADYVTALVHFPSSPALFVQCAWALRLRAPTNPCALRRDLAVAVARLIRDQRRRAPPSALARRLRASSFGKLRTTLSYVEGSLGPQALPQFPRSPVPPFPSSPVPQFLSLFCQAREVFQHLPTVRDRAAGQPRRSGLERQLSLRPRVTPGAGALDARLETLEANGLLHADVIVMVGLSSRGLLRIHQIQQMACRDLRPPAADLERAVFGGTARAQPVDGMPRAREPQPRLASRYDWPAAACRPFREIK